MPYVFALAIAAFCLLSFEVLAGTHHHHRCFSSVTGKFVSTTYAEAHPAATVCAKRKHK